MLLKIDVYLTLFPTLILINMNHKSLTVCIFSYNRAALLKNCVHSVQSNLPGCRLRVYDDNSDDRETKDYLDTLGEQVFFSKESVSGQRGGLYKNMQLALDEAETEYILFLQDDSQVVRFVDIEDIKIIDEFFATYLRSAFIAPCFFQGRSRGKYKTVLVPGIAGYFFSGTFPLSACCAIVIANVARLRAVRWTFLNGEKRNDTKARKYFSMMLQLAHPFVMHVPEPPVFRYKINTLANRISNNSIEPKYFKTMKTEEVKAMRSRPLSQMPFAEDFLHTQNPTVRKPYIYSNVSTELFYIRKLYKCELFFRKEFQKISKRWLVRRRGS